MSSVEVLRKELENMKFHCGALSNGQWVSKKLKEAMQEGLLALERIKDFEEKKLIAKQCLEYQGFKCNNKSCLNWFCPLNKRKVLKNE